MTPKLPLLGILQGLTEFLPVSSSGHLAIFQNLMGFENPPFAYDLVLHGATLLATLLFFRRVWLRVLRDWLEGWRLPPGKRSAGWKTGWSVLGGTAVTACVGYPLKGAVESAMGSLPLVGALLLVNAGILFLAGRMAGRSKEKAVTLPIGLGVGFVQGLAVFPGISRSGSTICSGLFLGLSPEAAFDFSFLMSLPSVAGAILLEALDAGGLQDFVLGLPHGWWIGAGAAFLSGLFALSILRRFVISGRWNLFAWYTAGLGILAVLAGLWGRG